MLADWLKPTLSNAIFSWRERISSFWSESEALAPTIKWTGQIVKYVTSINIGTPKTNQSNFTLMAISEILEMLN